MSPTAWPRVASTRLSGGYGKRTTLSEYRRTRRGSQGVRTTSPKYAAGRVVSVKIVRPDEDLLVTTKQGVVIRCPVSDIAVKGRATRGVRLQRLQEGDEVVAVARLVGEQEEEAAIEAAAAPGAPPPRPTPEIPDPGGPEPGDGDDDEDEEPEPDDGGDPEGS